MKKDSYLQYHNWNKIDKNHKHIRMTTKIGNYLPYNAHNYEEEEYEMVFGKSKEDIDMSWRHICGDEDFGKEILMSHYLIMEQWRRLWGFIHEHRPKSAYRYKNEGHLCKIDWNEFSHFVVDYFEPGGHRGEEE